MQRTSSTQSRTDIAQLEGIPNIGHSIAGDLRQLEIKSPSELLGRDPYSMSEELRRTNWNNSLKGRLIIEPNRAIRKDAKFRTRHDPDWTGFGAGPLEVNWKDVP